MGRIANTKNVFNLTLSAQNKGRKKQKKPKITAELLFLTSDIINISKDIESEFDVTFSPPLATMLGINPAIIKCPKDTTYVQFEYVGPKVVDTIANTIHFTPSDSADYSVIVKIGDVRTVKVHMHQCYQT